MSKREFYGATVEEALSKASSTLDLEQDKLEYEVLDKGSAGFLGLGLRDARVSVDVPAQLVDRSEAVVEAPSTSESETDEVLKALTEGHAIEPAGSEADGGSASTASGASEQVILDADEFLTGLVEVMGFDATVDAFDDGENVVVDVATPEAGLLIGQKGETIDAIQYLTNVVVYKARPFEKRIVVDSEGYRRRRIEAIQGMAHRAARRAARERRDLSLPPMSASERRIVHLYLQGNPSVSTASEGTDENRRVIVSPT